MPCEESALGQPIDARVDGRSPIGSGIARMTNADSHHARCIPMVHLKIGPLFTQITTWTSRKSGSARWRPTPREWKRWRSSAWNMTRMCVKIAHKRTTTPVDALKILLIPAIPRPFKIGCWVDSPDFEWSPVGNIDYLSCLGKVEHPYESRISQQ
jgi:hypothetical protein